MSGEQPSTEELQRELGVLIARVGELERAQVEHKQVEGALQESQELYRSLIQNSTLGLTLVDANHNIRMTNAVQGRLFNKAASAFVGKKCFEEFEKRNQVCPHCPGVGAMATGQPAVVETEGVRDDGSRFSARIHAFPAFGLDGAVTGFVEVVEDITDQKRVAEALRRLHEELEARVRERTAELANANEALQRYITERKQVEEALSRSREDLRVLVELSPDVIVRFDPQLRHMFVSPAVERIFGMPPEFFLGKTMAEVGLPPEAFRAWEKVVRSVFADGREREVEFELLGRTHRARLAAQRDANGRVESVVGIGRDITEHRRAQEERERLNAQLREAQKLEAVGRFGRGVAHDFNNLMVTVLGLASNMKSKRRPDHPDHVKLTHIEEAADTAAKLAHQLLDFAKGGKIRLHLLSFADVVTAGLVLVLPMVPRNVTLDRQINSDSWQVKCDQTQIQQVIVNLCRNALEAMSNGGRLMIRAENVALASPLHDAQPPLAAGEYACMSVEDTGCGMEATTMNRIFDPFFTTKERGHGLGLAAAYGVMAAHGGAISVTSVPGKGSTFRLWLPRAKRPAMPPISREH